MATFKEALIRLQTAIHELENLENSKSISIEVPPGTKSLTQWFKMGDHNKVLQDYESSCGGDTNIDEYFIDGKFTTSGSAKKVKSGDWIALMENGKFTVIEM